MKSAPLVSAHQRVRRSLLTHCAAPGATLRNPSGPCAVQGWRCSGSGCLSLRPHLGWFRLPLARWRRQAPLRQVWHLKTWHLWHGASARWVPEDQAPQAPLGDTATPARDTPRLALVRRRHASCLGGCRTRAARRERGGRDGSTTTPRPRPGTAARDGRGRDGSTGQAATSLMRCPRV
jgi:hypothetical protein